jgi:hypothetical protein
MQYSRLQRGVGSADGHGALSSLTARLSQSFVAVQVPIIFEVFALCTRRHVAGKRRRTVSMCAGTSVATKTFLRCQLRNRRNIGRIRSNVARLRSDWAPAVVHAKAKLLYYNTWKGKLQYMEG